MYLVIKDFDELKKVILDGFALCAKKHNLCLPYGNNSAIQALMFWDLSQSLNVKKKTKHLNENLSHKSVFMMFPSVLYLFFTATTCLINHVALSSTKYSLSAFSSTFVQFQFTTDHTCTATTGFCSYMHYEAFMFNQGL